MNDTSSQHSYTRRGTTTTTTATTTTKKKNSITISTLLLLLFSSSSLAFAPMKRNMILCSRSISSAGADAVPSSSSTLSSSSHSSLLIMKSSAAASISTSTNFTSYRYSNSSDEDVGLDEGEAEGEGVEVAIQEQGSTAEEQASTAETAQQQQQEEGSSSQQSESESKATPLDNQEQEETQETKPPPHTLYLHHTAIKTRNIENAIKFYSLLGYEVEHKFRSGPARAAWLTNSIFKADLSTSTSSTSSTPTPTTSTSSSSKKVDSPALPTPSTLNTIVTSSSSSKQQVQQEQQQSQIFGSGIITSQQKDTFPTINVKSSKPKNTLKLMPNFQVTGKDGNTSNDTNETSTTMKTFIRGSFDEASRFATVDVNKKSSSPLKLMPSFQPTDKKTNPRTSSSTTSEDNTTTTTIKGRNNIASRIELIEVPSYILNERPNTIKRSIDLIKNESLLGLNHYALDVTSYIDFLRSNNLIPKTNEECKDGGGDEYYGLDQFIEYIESISLSQFNKTVRIAVTPRQQVIGNQVYELAFIYDADGTIIELVRYIKEVELKDGLEMDSGWEPWDGKGFIGQDVDVEEEVGDEKKKNSVVIKKDVEVGGKGGKGGGRNDDEEGAVEEK